MGLEQPCNILQPCDFYDMVALFTAKCSHFVSEDFSKISQNTGWTGLNDSAATQLYGFVCHEITALLILLFVYLLKPWKINRKFKACEAVLKGNTFMVGTNLHQLHGRLSQICESNLSLRYIAHQ